MLREDAFVAKYNANGNQLWMAQFGTSGYDSATGVSSDGSGNVYVSGYTDGSFPSYTNLGSYDAFVAKYDTSGNPVWVKQFSTSSHDYAEGISSDSNGNVYVSGKTFGSFLGYTNLGLYDAFVAKYDGNGNQLWLRQFGTSGDDEITESVAIVVIMSMLLVALKAVYPVIAIWGLMMLLSLNMMVMAINCG